MGRIDWTDRGWNPRNQETKYLPLRWAEPKKIFVATDIFCYDVPFALLDEIFAIMAISEQHTFQIITEYPERMHEYLYSESRSERINDIIKTNDNLISVYQSSEKTVPLPNVWLGVRVRTQVNAEELIPHLLETPAAIRFLVVEPEESINFNELRPANSACNGDPFPFTGRVVYPSARGYLDSNSATMSYTGKIVWVVLNVNDRPDTMQWCQEVLDQCRHENVPVFMNRTSLLAFENDAFYDFSEEMMVQDFPAVKKTASNTAKNPEIVIVGAETTEQITIQPVTNSEAVVQDDHLNELQRKNLQLITKMVGRECEELYSYLSDFYKIQEINLSEPAPRIVLRNEDGGTEIVSVSFLLKLQNFLVETENTEK